MKLPINSNNSTPITWSRGMNALFHYTVHAYLTPVIVKPNEEAETKTTTEPHKHHTHDHKDCCSETSKQAKMNLIQDLLAGKKPELQDPTKEELDAMKDLKPIRTLISSSRKNDPKPFELRIGYSFSVKGMELCIKSMKVKERARFLVMPEYSEGFIQLEAIMRQEKMNRDLIAQGKAPLVTTGCSAHMSPEMMEISSGLEEAMGVALEFEFELLDVLMPNSFLKEAWEMTNEEKYNEVPLWKDQGGVLYGKKMYSEALEKYERCLVLLEGLSTCSIVLDMKKEKADIIKGIVTASIIPKENIISLDQIEDWTKSCRLNYAACKLKSKDYKSVIIQCTQVLALDSLSMKALFRRGQAYMELGRDLDLAERDFERVAGLVKIGSAEERELCVMKRSLESKFKIHLAKEKEMYCGKF